MQYRESFAIKDDIKKGSVLLSQSLLSLLRLRLTGEKTGLNIIMIFVLFPPVKSQPPKEGGVRLYGEWSFHHHERNSWQLKKFKEERNERNTNN